MPSPAHLLARLEAVASSLRTRPDALALLALGSVGLETDRLDEHSDLDFFVIVAPGARAAYLEDLGWLERAHPVAFSFANTPDGRKVLFGDGVFAEYAVFEMEALRGVPYAAGRLVWKREGVPDALAAPAAPAVGAPRSAAWQTNEALTNLFVGLHREARGERLSATRFIQQYAVDRVLDLATLQGTARAGHADAFMAERRFEQRFPEVAAALPGMVQGYARNGPSALCILAWLEAHSCVDSRMAVEIRRLAERVGAP
ncbi:hypothetical protein [Deinococcus maricopensis]|uniref:Uncharacterized protein n=1 Tax=Deinococcus maricopensis (strain DSM 21211 / LMG 22137 / NRRL B-23946 / LB-34) TaxID=709986 RepID=E8U4B8_DEIML|nr:hypothetical protein [Deinococcus maricopensis]ADV65955.1 hypothetical protein Deima_0294 [Deinococcus maricopensis DSM 21211]